MQEGINKCPPLMCIIYIFINIVTKFCGNYPVRENKLMTNHNSQQVIGIIKAECFIQYPQFVIITYFCAYTKGVEAIILFNNLSIQSVIDDVLFAIIIILDMLDSGKSIYLAMPGAVVPMRYVRPMGLIIIPCISGRLIFHS